MAERKSRSKAVPETPAEIEINIPEEVEFVTRQQAADGVPANPEADEPHEDFLTRQQTALANTATGGGVSLEVSLPDSAEAEKVFAAATVEFNEHVKSLVGLFFEEKIQGLDERIRDVELIVGQLASQRAPLQEPVQQTIDAPTYPSSFPDYSNGDVDVPEYRPPSHETGSSTPWYQG